MFFKWIWIFKGVVSIEAGRAGGRRKESRLGGGGDVPELAIKKPKESRLSFGFNRLNRLDFCCSCGVVK
jgi:hypothetical protein